MKFTVRLTSSAEADVRSAATWYEAQKDGLGVKFIEAVDLTINRISLHPTAFPVIAANLRRATLVKFPYALWFTVREDEMLVLACFHGRRNVPDLAVERVKEV